MPTLRRLSLHLLAFVVLMAAFTALTTAWHRLDYAAYHRFYLPRAVPFSPGIVVVDLPRHRTPSEDADPTDFRARLADLLTLLGAQPQPPDAVVLDIVFTNDTRGLPPLLAALDSLTAHGIEVYAVVDPVERSGNATVSAEEVWKDHAKVIYQDHLSGYGHTRINSPYLGLLSYDTEFALTTADGSELALYALPLKVVLDKTQKPAPAAQSLILALADSGEIAARTYRFEHAADSTSGGRFVQGAATAMPDVGDAIVLVGSIEEDTPEEITVAGPIVVASALSAQLSGGPTLQPNNKPAILIVQFLAFAALTAAVFALLFQYVKRLQTHPVLTALLSVVAALAALAGAGAVGMQLGFATPVGLTVIAILLAGALAYHYALKFLVTGMAEGSGKYDVFISYSRQQGDWVVANILEPLKAMRKADGSPLAIYFDKESISIGEAFTTKYMWAIVDSRFFLPVFSPEYYGKMHCRNEMDLGYKRAMDKRVALLPVALTLSAVPPIYAHLNIAIADQNAAFFDGLRKRLLEPDPPAAAS